MKERITPADIEANIVSEHFFNAREAVVAAEGSHDESDQPISYHNSLGLLTFCVLVLKNGFTVTGESACAHPGNYDKHMGRTLARIKAVDKIWPLMGYELKSRLASQEAQS
jgi:hypothetical protein